MKQPTEQLYTNRGSGEARLRPRIGDNTLNAKHGPRIGQPGVHETSSRAGPSGMTTAQLRERAGLRFKRG